MTGCLPRRSKMSFRDKVVCNLKLDAHGTQRRCNNGRLDVVVKGTRVIVPRTRSRLEIVPERNLLRAADILDCFELDH